MRKKILLKTHVNQEGKKILSLIDEKLLGKTIEEKEIQLNLNSNFFKGKTAEEKKILKEIETSYMIIAVGEKTTTLLEEKNIITKKDLKKIKNIPYIYIITRKN